MNPRRERRLGLALLALLYVVSIPWYRESEAPAPLWLGLPDWVTLALLCYAAAALLNFWLWRRTGLDEGDEPGEKP